MTLFRVRAKTMANPVVLLLVPTAISFSVWLLPGSSWVFHGWQQRTSASVLGVILLVTFYGYLSAIAWAAGSGVRRPTLACESRQLERLLFVASMIGVATFAALVLTQVDIVSALTTGNANLIDEALPDAAGPQTLRYLVVPFGSMSIAAMFARHIRASHIVGLLNLIIVCSASGRLLFGMAVFTGVLLHLTRREAAGLPAYQVTAKRLVGFGALMLFVLVLLTYPRVANTYADRGVHNPIAVTTSNLSSYLSAPAQVQLGVASAYGDPDFGNDAVYLGTPIDLALPSFLRAEARDGKEWLGVNHYGTAIDFSPRLTTNSVFADVSIERGGLGLVVVGFVAALFSFAAARSRQRWACGSGALIAGPLLYSFTEVWRANTFMLGSQTAVVLASTVALLIASHSATEKSTAMPSEIRLDDRVALVTAESR